MCITDLEASCEIYWPHLLSSQEGHDTSPRHVVGDGAAVGLDLRSSRVKLLLCYEFVSKIHLSLLFTVNGLTNTGQQLHQCEPTWPVSAVLPVAIHAGHTALPCKTGFLIICSFSTEGMVISTLDIILALINSTASMLPLCIILRATSKCNGTLRKCNREACARRGWVGGVACSFLFDGGSGDVSRLPEYLADFY